jgi:hypothetical protein
MVPLLIGKVGFKHCSLCLSRVRDNGDVTKTPSFLGMKFQFETWDVLAFFSKFQNL